MNDSRKYFDPQILAKLNGLPLRARQIVEGFVAGLHRSPHRGFSIEFAEHREYVPGDDLRYVDWKVFGRTDKFYLKQFEDETNLLCYLVLDSSESMTYRGSQAALSKIEYAQCLTAALAWLVIQQQDAVSFVHYDTQIRRTVAPSGSSAQLQNIIQVLDDMKPAGKTAAGPIFHDLAERFRKRGVVVILSDFFDDVPSLVAGLKHFRHRRHDVIVFQVLDSDEVDFPFDQPTRFLGLEGAPHIEVDPRSLRRAYQKEFEEYRQSVERACRQLEMDYQLVTTDQPLDTVLFHYLATRAQRVR